MSEELDLVERLIARTASLEEWMKRIEDIGDPVDDKIDIAIMQEAASEITRLRTQLAIKDKALRRIEFLILDDGLTKRDPYDQRWLEPRCLSCGRTAEEKHLADCEIGQALSPNTTEAAVIKESLNTDHIGDVNKMIRCEACNGTGEGFGRNALCLSCFGTGTISTCKESLHVPDANTTEEQRG